MQKRWSHALLNLEAVILIWTKSGGARSDEEMQELDLISGRHAPFWPGAFLNVGVVLFTHTHA